MVVNRVKFILLSLVFFANTVGAESLMQPQPIPSKGLSLLKHAQLIEPVQPDVKINFTIWLKLKHQELLDQQVLDIYNNQSPHYHQFITHEQFNENYAPDGVTENTVADYFTEQGITIERMNHRIRIVATVQQVEKLLHVRMNHYRYQQNIFFANATEPKLPPALAEHVTAITGLNNFPSYFPAFVKPPQSKHNFAELKKMHQMVDVGQSVAATTKSQNGFFGNNLQKVYNIANIPPVNGVAIDGTGQTIVIVDSCGNNTPAEIMADANLYNATGRIKPLSNNNFAVVDQHGAPYVSANCIEPRKTGWTQEIALDVEAAHTLAPGANIVLVLVPSSVYLDSGLADLIDHLTSNHFSIAGFANAYVISNSWGGVEYPNNAINGSFEQAAAEGLSINFATGDDGDNIQRHGSLSVMYPASSQYVTAVGGTSLFVGEQWDYAFETGWGTRSVSSAFLSGSGGGLSRYYPLPAWQRSIGAFVAGGYSQGTIAKYKGRALPDISMLGDPSTGLYIFERSHCLYWCIIGGTSLATPLFSATLAQVNQARALRLGVQSPIGLAAPALYEQFATLTSANALNEMSPPGQSVPGAQQVSGAPLSAFVSKGVIFNWDSSLSSIDGQFWSDVVGVGSPNVPNFIATMMLL